jgi:hypothetical protein
MGMKPPSSKAAVVHASAGLLGAGVVGGEGYVCAADLKLVTSKATINLVMAPPVSCRGARQGHFSKFGLMR